MSHFFSRQLEQIRIGGMPELWKRICAFPGWSYDRLPWWFVTSKYGSRVAYYSGGLQIAVILRPRWAKAHALLASALIRLGRFDDAYAAWERAFLLKPMWEDRPVWNDFHEAIHYSFLFHGQTKAALNIMQRVFDARTEFVREHQLEKLGIRFLTRFTYAIGHIALLDYYVKMDILGQRSSSRPIVLVHPRLANRCYLDYWRRYLPDMITDQTTIDRLSPLAKYLEDHIFAVMDSDNRQIFELNRTGWEAVIQAQWEAEGRAPLLILADADRERGWNCLKSLGVPADAWFVGLHVREEHTPIQEARNADIKTYRMAIESIVARGGWVIRMGDPSMEPLPSIPGVIDYAHSEVRSDWMDVFLWANCRFFLGTQSGPAWVPPTFGVPCVITNWASSGLRPWFSKDIYILKLHWVEGEARYLNFAEVISSAAAWAECAGYRKAHGIRLLDNTSEEINDVVVEMMDKLDGKQNYSQADEELQKGFDNLYVSNDSKSKARIGRSFLKKWAHLL